VRPYRPVLRRSSPFGGYPWALWAVGHYGTIASVAVHRVRLTDEDIELVIAALWARAAMAGPLRRHRIVRLAKRLSQMSTGNPVWTLGKDQVHEEDLDSDP
jgi:hypothetical protein